MSEATPTGFFSLGVSPERYQLPHPPLGLPVILLILRVLCRAFVILREGEFRLAEAKEDEVTAALRAVIENDLRQTGSIPGFNRRSYEHVGRQGQVANVDGTRLTKSPDLCFKLRHDDCEPRMALSEFDALFVECKPVDATHFAGRHYCDDGLIRFVRGDYAWAMQEGVMLAYVRDGRTIAGHLIPAMNEPDRVAPGRYRPVAPTDPYVLALEHTVPRITGSLCAGKLNVRCAREPAETAPKELPRKFLSINRLRQREGLSRRYDFPPPVPPRFVAFAWRYLGRTRSVRSSAGECAAEAWSWSPGSSGRDITEETTGSPKFLGSPDCPFAHVQSTPAGLLAPDHCGAATWPLVCEQQGLPRKVFRSSIAWLSDWLSTLRRAGYTNLERYLQSVL